MNNKKGPRLGSDPTWDPNDYMFDFPTIHYTGEIVDAPLPLKVSKVIQHVNAVAAEAEACIGAGAELSPLLAGLASVDYLAGFKAGRRTNARDYTAFLAEYFPEVYHPVREWIYTDLRCGLMHNLVAVNPWQGEPRDYRIASLEGDHLSDFGGPLVFRVDMFWEDIWRACRMYSYQLVMRPDSEPNLVTNFHKRFDRLSGAAALMENT